MTLDPDCVQAVFLAALEQETLAGRSAVLDRECAADDELRRRVEALLIAYHRPDGLLDRSFIDSGEQIAAARESPADPTDRERPRPSDPEHMP